jgi:hypothetical protein
LEFESQILSLDHGKMIGMIYNPGIRVK